MNEPMIQPASWKELQDAGLLWWINRTLHLFGWAIVFDVESDGTIIAVYPARVRFRGFPEADENEGWTKLTHHIDTEMPRLLKDVE